jgi:hypothetical protein
MDNTCCSHFYKNNDDNLLICISKLQIGKVIIIPDDSTYFMVVNAINTESKTFLEELTKDNNLITFGLSWDLLRLLYPINNDLYTKINDFIQKYNDLTFIINFKIKNTIYKVCIPSRNTNLNKILQKFTLPIYGTYCTNLNYGFDCSNKEMIEFTYKDYGIDILYDEEPCKYGYNYTEIYIDESVIQILKPGLYYNKFENIENNYEISKTVYAKKPKTFMFNFIDYELKNMNDIDINNSIYKLFNNYLENAIIIDFNGKNKILSFKSYAYVDLSEDGDIYEALYNINNVIFQILQTNAKVLLIYNIFSINTSNESKILDYILKKFSDNKNLLIPYNFFTDEERERWKYYEIDNELVEIDNENIIEENNN